MFGIFSKSLFIAAMAAMVAAIAAGIDGYNRTGVTLLVFTSVLLVAIGAALALTGIREAVILDASARELFAPPAKPSIDAGVWPALGAGAAIAAGLAFVFGTPAIAVAGVLALLAFIGWAGVSFRENVAWSPTVAGRSRTQFVRPFGIPVVSLVVILFVGICVSRVLLALPKEGSLIFAIVVAVMFLGGATALAMVQHRNAAFLAALTSIAIVLLILAGIAGLIAGERKFEGHEPAGYISQFQVAAAVDTNAFNVNRIVVPPQLHNGATVPPDQIAVGHNGVPFKITVTNNNPRAHHNMSFYTANPDLGGVAVWQGGWVSPLQTQTYVINPVRFVGTNSGWLSAQANGDPATYYFRCDVHPNMNGYVTVPSVTEHAVDLHEEG